MLEYWSVFTSHCKLFAHFKSTKLRVSTILRQCQFEVLFKIRLITCITFLSFLTKWSQSDSFTRLLGFLIRGKGIVENLPFREKPTKHTILAAWPVSCIIHVKLPILKGCHRPTCNNYRLTTLAVPTISKWVPLISWIEHTHRSS